MVVLFTILNRITGLVGDIDIFLMDKEGRHDEEMVTAIDDVVAFLKYRQ